MIRIAAFDIYKYYTRARIENQDGRNGDADKDGYTNLEEYLNSLCPLSDE